MNEAAEVVRQGAVDDTNIIFGATIDERLTGQVWVTVVATGLGGERRPRRPLAVHPRDVEPEGPARAAVLLGRMKSATGFAGGMTISAGQPDALAAPAQVGRGGDRTTPF